MESPISPADARSALAQVENARRVVIDEVDIPLWYWWALAIGWIALGVITDTAPSWVTSVATLAFGAAHSTVAPRVVSGRHGTGLLSVRADVVGKRVSRLVLGGLVGLAGLTVAGALAARADGARHPVTIASIGVALILVLGGPHLLAAVRRRLAQGGR
jgi:hypothetical protein